MAALAVDDLGATAPDAGQLCSMFPFLARALVEDVLQQCGNDGQKALEALLSMVQDEASNRAVSPQQPGMPAPSTNQELLAFLYPPERQKSNAPASEPKAEWGPDQDLSCLAVAPWLDPGFGNFEQATHATVENSKTVIGQHRSWWPTWDTVCNPAPSFLSPAPTAVASSPFPPELPSEEGWSFATQEVQLSLHDPASNGSSWTNSPPVTPLQLDGTPVVQDGSDSPELSENELLEALPHLAMMLHTPSPSGTSSPVGSLSPPNSTRHQPAFPDAELPAFHDGSSGSAPHFLDPDLFPNLKRDIVEDIMRRYDGATAMKHLMMLSQCVAEASTDANGKEVPDKASWGCDTGSSSGDEAVQEGPAVPSGDLTALENLEILKLQFLTINATEVASVLDACDNKLEGAVQLLGRFAQEDAAALPSAGGAVEVSDALAAVQLVAEAQEEVQPEVPSPSEVATRVQQLCRCFPAVAEEFVQIALQLASFDIAGAHKVLLDQGYSEVVEAEQHMLQPGPAASPQPAIVAPVPSLLAVLLPTSRSPPKASLSLSERTYQRNQQIYEEERAQQNRLVMAKRKCRELAYEHRQRGEYVLAEQLYQQASRYQEQEDHERKLAARRIGKRVNAGCWESITEDLHAKHVDEVLDMVSEQIRSLPKCFSRGVQVMYITGKGKHSANGTKIKPALMEMLCDHNIPCVDGDGHVVATFTPA